MDFASAIGSVVPGTFVPDIGTDETPTTSAIPTSPTIGDSGASFKDTVKQMLSDVNDKLNVSDQNAKDLATGKTNDTDRVVTSIEEANLALQYTMSIRTKLLDAYTQISQIAL
jgi:flagellar hook-basal body complex protein FliE